jgi:hypothetical protein
MGKNAPPRDTQDGPAKAEPPCPSLIDFLSNPGRAVAPEVELDLRRGRPDEAACESEFFTAEELLALTRERGSVLTEADARAIDKLKPL